MRDYLFNDGSFYDFLDTLSEKDKEKVSSYFVDLESHILLPRNEKVALIKDFEKAIYYYTSSNIPIDVALKRMNIHNLGGFYSRSSLSWYPLDDAAKIYPLSMKHGQMAIFRLSVYLKTDIIPELLQIALTFTIKRFPSFATTVKKGLFWHYLDSTKRRYSVFKENGIPCKPIKISNSGSQSFRVLYYNNRISIEYFHILTDGSGGMMFLKTLTAEYLRLLGTKFTRDKNIFDINELPLESELANEFGRSSKTKHLSGFTGKNSLQLGGKLSKIKPCRIIHFKMDADKLKKVAKSKDATITAYLLAIMFVAGKMTTDEINGEFNIQVPVNLRKYYKSDTIRNFSLYSVIKLSASKIKEVNSIIPDITSQLIKKTDKESMNEMMNSTQKMVGTLKYVPLAIKAPLAKIVYGFLGDKMFSNTLSNLGVINMPKELSNQIESMDVVLGTSITNRATCSLVTFNDKATFTIAKATKDPFFEEMVYKLLKKDGIIPIMEGSEIYEN